MTVYMHPIQGKIMCVNILKIMLLVNLILSMSSRAETQIPADIFNEIKTLAKVTKGDVVYVDFWASWCNPCRKSFPWLNTANTAYKSHGLKVVAVNVDKDKQLANDFLDKVDVSFPVLYDPDGRFAQAFQLKGMPSSFILDDKGEVLASHVGFFEDKIDIYEEKIESLLTH